MVTTVDVLSAVRLTLLQIEDKMVKNDIVGAHEQIQQSITDLEKVMNAIEKAKETAPIREKIERK